MSDEASRATALTFWARGHRRLVGLLAHVVIFCVSWLLAFGLAYNFRNFSDWLPTFFVPLLPIVVAVKLAIFYASGLHRGSWRYVAMRDVIQIAYASWFAFAWIFALYYGAMNFESLMHWFGYRDFQFQPFGDRDFPDSVLILDFAGTIALVAGARFAVRLYYEEIQPVDESAMPKLLILGAGNAGENVVREILRQPTLNYRVIGFLDDDPAKWGSIIHGREVFGPISRIKETCAEHAVDEVLIAMPSANKQQIRRVVDQCQGANLRFKTLPAIADLIAGRTQVQQIRNVDINDLLGRAPVRLDEERIAEYIRGRVVMVTGAGGSIGAEMCRQVARYEPRRLVLLEQAEQHLFDIDRELRAAFPALDVVPCIADIADVGRVRAVLRVERPTAVFHAAAHKHVPMMEHNPGEAIKNNVRGTMILADVAAEFGVEKFVMISTDKAVNPTSIMGCSKRVAEMYIQGLNERVATEFVTVRFGNVLGSSGSVVPIFKEQIARGGPVTVTHPDMVRYFMTIPEAAQLVLQAGSMGAGGEIFVLDMGEPVKIVDLARDLITLSGLRVGEDVEISFTGVRPGEKLFEELSIEGEGISQTSHPKIGVWQRRDVEWDWLIERISALLRDADELDRRQARRRLKEIVPEFYLEPPAAESAVPAAEPAPTPAPGTLTPVVTSD